MNKLINNFKEYPNVKNAQAIIKYRNKHPMVDCTMSKEDHETYEKAWELATGDRQ